jgi:hypothetical protein
MLVFSVQILQQLDNFYNRWQTPDCISGGQKLGMRPDIALGRQLCAKNVGVFLPKVDHHDAEKLTFN